MKFAEINARFTQIVAEYMGKGYTINTASMAGSQGEIGKVDLTNGTEIIRVLLGTFNHPCTRINGRFYSFEGIELIVGRVTDKITPNSSSTFQTAWNEHLERLHTEGFYQIGREKRGGGKWYGTKEEAMAQQDKNWNRIIAWNVDSTKDLTDAAKRIVLPFVRRQQGCKSVREAEITSVKKCTYIHVEGSHVVDYARYIVEARGKSFRLQ